jgi:hypothetical protein
MIADSLYPFGQRDRPDIQGACLWVPNSLSAVRRDAKILPSPVLLVSWLTPSIAIDRSVVASPLLVR